MSELIPASRVPARCTRQPTARNPRRPYPGRPTRAITASRPATCWQHLPAALAVHMTAGHHPGWMQTSQIGLTVIPGRCSR